MRLSADPDASLRGEFRPLAQTTRVLSLDPGLMMGFAIYSPDEGAQSCGSINLRHCGDVGELLAEAADEIAALIQARKPTLLAVERPFGRRGFTSDTPGLLCGVAHMVAFQHGIPRREFTASAVKKAVCGNGRATKRDVWDAVRARYGFDPPDDHAADAAAVAVLAWAREQQV